MEFSLAFLSSTRGDKGTGKVGGKRGALQLHPGLQVAAVIPPQIGFKKKKRLRVIFLERPSDNYFSTGFTCRGRVIP